MPAAADPATVAEGSPMGAAEPATVRLRHRLEAALAAAVIRLLGALPPRRRYALAGRLGAWSRHLDRRHRRHARDSLALRYGAAGVEDKVRTVFRELGHLGAELPLLERREPAGLTELVVAEEGRAHIDAMAADARGVVVLSAHLGNWELLGHLLPHYGLSPFHVVYRPLDNPLLDRHLRANRERHGARAIDRNNASRPILQALRRGETVAMLNDQNTPGTGRVRLPFLGEEARVPTALARFARRTDSPILPVFLLREGPERFRLVALEPIEPGRYPDSEAGLRDLTAETVAATEAAIARAPAQWFWVHRRWRSKHAPRRLAPGAPPPPPWRGGTLP
ncbi:MAG TPA: lysophospholipid acyltransferase family protein [Gammaproteobacteria bacterium]|nr:lysophospholipid acyltransferase family protein [Gammaproteobacteria bacterium]